MRNPKVSKLQIQFSSGTFLITWDCPNKNGFFCKFRLLNSLQARLTVPIVPDIVEGKTTVARVHSPQLIQIAVSVPRSSPPVSRLSRAFLIRKNSVNTVITWSRKNKTKSRNLIGYGRKKQNIVTQPHWFSRTSRTWKKTSYDASRWGRQDTLGTLSSKTAVVVRVYRCLVF